MKRFASIDFLRGIAIIMMLVLHQVIDYLDIDGLLVNMNDGALVNILMMVILSFMGGLAGFFLLVSAIGNSISMTKHLMKGKTVLSLALKQMIGGFILYIFAMLSEGTIGYHGGIMGVTRRLDQPLSVDWYNVYARWGVFETIHTIAWCIIINGAIHALLSRKDGWRNPKKQMIIYAILTIVVIAATSFVWRGVSNLMGTFPWADAEGGGPIYSPHLLTNSLGTILLGAICGALAGPLEPLFPYLAVSFMGTMIGIGIAQPEKGLFKWFFKMWFLIGLMMFLVGMAGVIITVLGIMMSGGFDRALSVYMVIYCHRMWTPDTFSELSWISYLWQFLLLNGFAVLIAVTFIYLVEFRGKGEKFGEKTKFVRRFGFVAFTGYNMQYIYSIVFFVFPQYIGFGPYGKLMWGNLLFGCGITILIYHVINSVWEKANYRGSLEWIIAFIASFIIPGKGKERKTWKQRGDLAVDGGFYNVEWISLVEANEKYHGELRDSKAAFRFALLSFLMPLFIPFSCGTLAMAIKARKTEGKNKYMIRALILSSIGTGLTALFTFFVLFFSLTDLGIVL